MAEACGTCRYFVRTDDDKGQCRRYPPESNEAYSWWPTVDGADWCGEYVIRPPKPHDA